MAGLETSACPIAATGTDSRSSGSSAEQRATQARRTNEQVAAYAGENRSSHKQGSDILKKSWDATGKIVSPRLPWWDQWGGTE